jgi:hypothetical protein
MVVPPERLRLGALGLILQGQETRKTQFVLEGETRQRSGRIAPGTVKAKFRSDEMGEGTFLFVSVVNNASAASLELICGTDAEARAAPLFPVEWTRFDCGFFQNPGNDAAGAEAARLQGVERATRKPETVGELVVLDTETDALTVSVEHYSQFPAQLLRSVPLPPRRSRGHKLDNWQPGVNLRWCSHLFELSDEPFENDDFDADGDDSTSPASLPSSPSPALLALQRSQVEEQTGPERFLRVTRRESMVKSADKK